MAQQERYTDHLIISLLEKVGIKAYTKGNSIKELSEAFTHASKNDTEHRGQPDLTAVVGNFALVFEDKADTKQQAKYISSDKKDLLMDATSIKNYAENGALHYALKIVQHTNFKNVIAFGCSGTEEGRLIITPIFVSQAGYQILPRLTSFEPIKNIENYYREVILGKDSLEMVELKNILDKSTILHEALRNYGQLGVTEKPLIVSALLLALQDEQFTTEQLKGLQDDQTDGKILFEAIKRHIDRADIQPEEKKETVLNQFRVLVYRPFLSQFNDKLGKTPLKYFAEYLYSNVLNAIYNNHPEDVLGRFYGEFMRYGGGDGQNLGIVLTPRHITELFVDLLDIQPSDKVLDPCCGTGGFLIAAMTKMLNKTKDEGTKRNIKLNQLHGIEIRDDMFAIATTNMILRGDGKSNLKCEDFLKKDVQELRDQHFTIGLMNPPYAQGKNEDTRHLSELQFICHLLDSLDDNAKCAVIVPQSTMTGNNSKNDKDDKRYIYDHHTIEGVITLNTKTFYPVGTNPVIAIFTAHKPHPADKKVKFINFQNDGYEVIPHIGLMPTTHQQVTEQRKHLLACWRNEEVGTNDFIIRTTIQPEDEWLHSFYYFNETIPTEEQFHEAMADYISFQCTAIAHGRAYLFEETTHNEPNGTNSTEHIDWKNFKLTEVFQINATKSGIDKKNLIKDNGKYPYITRSNKNNGIDNYITTQPQYKTDNRNVLIVGLDTQTVFYQPYNFYTGQNIQVLYNEHLNKYNAIFIIPLLKTILQKFNWGGNGATLTRLKHSQIMLPVTNDGTPDWDYMEQQARQRDTNIKKPIMDILTKQYNTNAVYLKDHLLTTTFNDLKWEKLQIGDVCIVSGTKTTPPTKLLPSGKTPRITCTAGNNGLEGTYKNPFTEKGDVLTVDSATIGAIAYQPYNFIATDHVEKIARKGGEKIGHHCGTFLKVAIETAIRDKYGYGYKFSQTRMTHQQLYLPFTPSNTPDWDFMETYMCFLEQGILKELISKLN